MRFKTTVLCVTLGISASAFGINGTYIQIGGGYVNESGLPGAPASLGSNLRFERSQKHLGANVIFGYNYDISKQFGLGVQVGWTYYGENTLELTQNGQGYLSPTQNDVSAWDIAMEGTWHVTPTWDLFIKGGYADVNYSESFEDIGGPDSYSGALSHNRWHPLAGIGIGYNITDTLQANLTYTHIFGDDMNYARSHLDSFSDLYMSNNSVPRLDALMLNIKYVFGASLFNHAVATNETNQPVDHTGPYVSGALGWVNQTGLIDYDVLGKRVGATLHHKRKHFGGAVAFGYNYDLTSQFGLGVEAGWGYYGKIKITTPGVDDADEFTAWDVAGVGTWHLEPSIDLFVKGGMAEVNSQSNWLVTSSGGQSNSVIVTANRWKPLAAIGAGYNITPSIQANITYTHIFGDDVEADNTPAGLFGSNDNQVPRLDSLLIGLTYRF